MKYKVSTLYMDKSTLGTGYNEFIQDSDTVYINNRKDCVALRYFNLTSSDFGTANINIPYASTDSRCAPIGDNSRLAVIKDEYFDKGWTIRLRVNVKLKAYDVYIQAANKNNSNDWDRIISDGDPTADDNYETHMLYIDQSNNNYGKPSIVIGYTDKAYRCNMAYFDDYDDQFDYTGLQLTSFSGASYTTSLVDYNIVDFSFKTTNEDIVIQQLAYSLDDISEIINQLDHRIRLLESSETAQYVSR